jgi:hypothetical protein
MQGRKSRSLLWHAFPYLVWANHIYIGAHICQCTSLDDIRLPFIPVPCKNLIRPFSRSTITMNVDTAIIGTGRMVKGVTIYFKNGKSISPTFRFTVINKVHEFKKRTVSRSVWKGRQT